LLEERFVENLDFVHGQQSEPGHRPDFLFPSHRAYSNPDFNPAGLTMLAVKTTCRDRWRQVLNEAARIPVKHLLTVQEGVSEAQHREMAGAGVRLVVPAPLHRSYPEAVRPHLLTLAAFIDRVRPQP
jgi:hypothetical protein